MGKFVLSLAVVVIGISLIWGRGISAETEKVPNVNKSVNSEKCSAEHIDNVATLAIAFKVKDIHKAIEENSKGKSQSEKRDFLIGMYQRWVAEEQTLFAKMDTLKKGGNEIAETNKKIILVNLEKSIIAAQLVPLLINREIGK